GPEGGGVVRPRPQATRDPEDADRIRTWHSPLLTRPLGAGRSRWTWPIRTPGRSGQTWQSAPRLHPAPTRPGIFAGNERSATTMPGVVAESAERLAIVPSAGSLNC